MTHQTDLAGYNRDLHADVLEDESDTSECEADDDPSHDLVLATKDMEFRVHSSLLRSVSPVFEVMLTHDFAEKRDGRVEIDDLSAEQVEAFLTQVYYHGPLTADTIMRLFPVAHKYLVQGLVDECVQWVHTHASEFDPTECVRVIDRYQRTQWSDAVITALIERNRHRHDNFLRSLLTLDLNQGTINQIMGRLLWGYEPPFLCCVAKVVSEDANNH